MRGPLKARARLVAPLAVAAAVTLAGCGNSSRSVGVSSSVFHLKVGDCLVPPSTVQAELASIKVVACHEPHTQEVFALVQDSGAGDNYPGDTALRTFADGNCLQAFAGYVGVDYRYSQLFYTYLLPSVRSWAAKDRTIVCVVTTTGQQLDRSVKGSKR